MTNQERRQSGKTAETHRQRARIMLYLFSRRTERSSDNPGEEVARGFHV